MIKLVMIKPGIKILWLIFLIFSINYVTASDVLNGTIINASTINSNSDLAAQIQEKLANLQCKPPVKVTECNVSNEFKYSVLTSVTSFGRQTLATMRSPSGVNLDLKHGSIIEGYKLYSIKNNELIFERTNSCSNCICKTIIIKRNYFDNTSLLNPSKSNSSYPISQGNSANQASDQDSTNVPPIIINKSY